MSLGFFLRIPGVKIQKNVTTALPPMNIVYMDGTTLGYITITADAAFTVLYPSKLSCNGAVGSSVTAGAGTTDQTILMSPFNDCSYQTWVMATGFANKTPTPSTGTVAGA